MIATHLLYDSTRKLPPDLIQQLQAAIVLHYHPGDIPPGFPIEVLQQLMQAQSASRRRIAVERGQIVEVVRYAFKSHDAHVLNRYCDLLEQGKLPIGVISYRFHHLAMAYRDLVSHLRTVCVEDSEDCSRYITYAKLPSLPLPAEVPLECMLKAIDDQRLQSFDEQQKLQDFRALIMGTATGGYEQGYAAGQQAFEAYRHRHRIPVPAWGRSLDFAPFIRQEARKQWHQTWNRTPPRPMPQPPPDLEGFVLGYWDAYHKLYQEWDDDYGWGE